MDRLSRSTLLRAFFGAIALTAIGIISVSAEEDPAKYPTRPIHVIVGFTAGGGNDIIARVVGQK
jgi:tripartite-type tricarboxylate transporter receptor subunit TctC